MELIGINCGTRTECVHFGIGGRAELIIANVIGLLWTCEIEDPPPLSRLNRPHLAMQREKKFKWDCCRFSTIKNLPSTADLPQPTSP